jgi:hypothetical protein
MRCFRVWWRVASTGSDPAHSNVPVVGTIVGAQRASEPRTELGGPLRRGRLGRLRSVDSGPSSSGPDGGLAQWPLADLSGTVCYYPESAEI